MAFDITSYILGKKSGGGGGGSSDFSTATVTFVHNESGGIEMYGAFIGYYGEDDTPTMSCVKWTDDADTQKLVLYKGNSMIDLKTDGSQTVTVSGDATEDYGYVYVTGDCTITIS